MRIFLSTSDKHLWALRPCLHLMEKYWPAHPPLCIAGYSRPDFSLPAPHDWYSIGAFADYPVERWSDGIIQALNDIPDELILWWMEDFWLLRNVDTEAIELVAQYMTQHRDVARVDLSSDRLYAGNVREVGALGWLDLITNDLPVPYLLSFQAGIWRRSELLRYLVPGETPWQTEINGTARMNEAGARVLGTRQWLTRYLIAIQHGKVTLDGGYQVPPAALRAEDWQELEALDYLEPL